MAAPLGNKFAEKKNRVVGDTLRRVAAQNPKKLRAACEALLDKAAGGDYGAFKEIRDTLDGKPNQSISGPDEGPIQVSDPTRPALSKEEWLKLHHVGTATRTAK